MSRSTIWLSIGSRGPDVHFGVVEVPHHPALFTPIIMSELGRVLAVTFHQQIQNNRPLEMASVTTKPRIIELAQMISNSTEKLQNILTAKSIPSPTFDENAPTKLPAEASEDRDVILDAASELYDLLLEPLTALNKTSAMNNLVHMQLISRYGIAEMIPPGGTMTFAEIASKTGINENIVRRILRHGMTHRVFREPQPRTVAHTKLSRQLANSNLSSWAEIAGDEMWLSNAKMLDAALKWPNSQEPSQTGFTVASNTASSIYEALGKDPERAEKFSSSMKAYADSPGYDVNYLLDNFDWKSLGQVRILDIGGARGHIAIALTSQFPELSVTVQDLGHVVDGADQEVPQPLRQRVCFQEYNFFSPQSVSADVYIFRWIFHNWSDKYCIEILRAQIPSFRSGARILIQDGCLPEPGEIPLWMERDMRAMDLTMAAVFNAKERALDDWKALLTEADARFEMQNVIQPKGSALAIIDVRWTV
ncbi:hypothetical protein QQS21_009512 [Conoideocrella luteorostrata]|uniref:O-methyltransferase n=1 Tax=Conoideocrella luteorostrata TaxID=1105319 RepID=A0AAJ0CGT4_9HYPO|nr:hypothetical protein QQS21_009512 [Conoideocrella luteorostrata]